MEELLKDNVQYLEFRTSFGSIYDEHKTYTDPADILKMYQDVIEK